jgi:ankyrin repeat protein
VQTLKKEGVKETQLQDAVQLGLVSARLLLEAGADYTAGNEEGMTALHFKSVRESEEIVELLLRQGADITAKDIKGQTVLHDAGKKGCDNVVKLLLKTGRI